MIREARRCARAGTVIEGVTAKFGASIVSTEAENVIAAHAALKLLAAHHTGFDAAIVAMSFDTGVFAARTVLPIRIVGITEAASHTACMMGRRFGMVVLGANTVVAILYLAVNLSLAALVCWLEARSGTGARNEARRTLMDVGV